MPLFAEVNEMSAQLFSSPKLPITRPVFRTNRELKQRRWRLWGRRLVKNKLIFYQRTWSFHVRNFTKPRRQWHVTKRNGTSPNRKTNEQNNDCTYALQFLVDFFTVLCKTETWNVKFSVVWRTCSTTTNFLNFLFQIHRCVPDWVLRNFWQWCAN